MDLVSILVSTDESALAMESTDIGHFLPLSPCLWVFTVYVFII